MANATNTKQITLPELQVGNIAHFHGARFEITAAKMLPESMWGKSNGNGDVMVANGKWLDGQIVNGYFGPTKDWTFQGNKLATVVIEVTA